MPIARQTGKRLLRASFFSDSPQVFLLDPLGLFQDGEDPRILADLPRRLTLSDPVPQVGAQEAIPSVSHEGKLLEAADKDVLLIEKVAHVAAGDVLSISTKQDDGQQSQAFGPPGGFQPQEFPHHCLAGVLELKHPELIETERRANAERLQVFCGPLRAATRE